MLLASGNHKLRNYKKTSLQSLQSFLINLIGIVISLNSKLTAFAVEICINKYFDKG